MVKRFLACFLRGSLRDGADADLKKRDRKKDHEEVLIMSLKKKNIAGPSCTVN